MVELLSTVIEHLVKGEIMQMKPSASGKSALDYYLRKNFYKTASLMGHSCLAAAVLGEFALLCNDACCVLLYVCRLWLCMSTHLKVGPDCGFYQWFHMSTWLCNIFVCNSTVR